MTVRQFVALMFAVFSDVIITGSWYSVLKIIITFMFSVNISQLCDPVFMWKSYGIVANAKCKQEAKMIR